MSTRQFRRDFNNIIFKIKHKSYIALGSAPAPPKKFLGAPIAETYVPVFFSVAQQQK
jgi:hypothetical protein